MVDGDVSSTKVVTFKTITETRKDGTMVTKRVLVSLDTPNNVSTIDDIPAEEFSYNYESENISPPPMKRTNTKQVGTFYNHLFLLIDVFSDPK